MRRNAPGRSPAKIAEAATATTAAMAGSGSRKKVTGTRSAAPIVAVSPGMAPSRMPKALAATMVRRTSGARMLAKAESSVSTATFRRCQGRSASITP